MKEFLRSHWLKWFENFSMMSLTVTLQNAKFLMSIFMENWTWRRKLSCSWMMTTLNDKSILFCCPPIALKVPSHSSFLSERVEEKFYFEKVQKILYTNLSSYCHRWSLFMYMLGTLIYIENYLGIENRFWSGINQKLFWTFIRIMREGSKWGNI